MKSSSKNTIDDWRAGARRALALLLGLALFAVTACSGSDSPSASPSKSDAPAVASSAEATSAAVDDSVHQPDTVAFIKMLDENPDLKELFEAALAKGVEINPDRVTNPAQNLEEYYSFLDWATLCMPWNILYNPSYPSLLDSIDQSLN
ncbi:MAG: hypothetical protein LBG11_04545, partial [Bifidobacteriaceae bacterium]|nr:hypothetical protein [Bifidobacteriaceae bacterium]